MSEPRLRFVLADVETLMAEAPAVDGVCRWEPTGWVRLKLVSDDGVMVVDTRKENIHRLPRKEIEL